MLRQYHIWEIDRSLTWRDGIFVFTVTSFDEFQFHRDYQIGFDLAEMDTDILLHLESILMKALSKT
jgi:hypothetical protein